MWKLRSKGDSNNRKEEKLPVPEVILLPVVDSFLTASSEKEKKSFCAKKSLVKMFS